MDESMRRQWAERTVRAVSAAFPEIEFSTWLRCEQCLPHASSCAALIKQYQLISPEAGHLFTYAGHYLSERGLYEQAESYLMQALAMREQLFSPDHPDTITTLVHLGNCVETRDSMCRLSPICN